MSVEPKVFDHVKKILASFNGKYMTGDVLKRTAIIEDLDKYDDQLMEALLSDQLIHDTYTKKIAGVEVFEVNQFVSMLEFKDYWEDSYTKYSNKIGLTAGGKFIDENEDVVLDFPYKDCVLKAGMTKEDAKDNDEPFLNEVIAKPEIDEMLEPKIFVNAKKYDKDGVHDATGIDDSDNLIIKGNNLIALYSLKERYAGKVKLIYIDVPYFFKKKISEDSFSYNSDFKLSTWLTFMKNRFEIAKSLLSPSGSIWINISDDGMHYLKVLADSVFGANAFIGTIPRKTRNGKSDVPFNLSQDFDWILTYANTENPQTNIVGRKVDRKYYTTPDFPDRPWRTADLTKQTTPKERPNSDFTMVNPKTGKEYPVNPKRSWAVTRDTFDEWYQKGGIGFPDDYDFMSGNRPFRRVFKEEDDATDKKPSSVSSDFLMKLVDNVSSGKTVNKFGNDEIATLFDRDKFSYAKPERLIKEILLVGTKENDLVLDFFMGSATTQAVAMKMHRRFIGIEQMDYINTVSVPRLQKVIEGEQGGISKDVNWQGGGSFVYAELMEKNGGYVKDVMSAKKMSELFDVFERMKDTTDFDFRVDLEKFQQELHGFSDVDEARKELLRILDKNQLYYNYANIDDSNVRDLVDDADYKFNKSFYED